MVVRATDTGGRRSWRCHRLRSPVTHRGASPVLFQINGARLSRGRLAALTGRFVGGLDGEDGVGPVTTSRTQAPPQPVGHVIDIGPFVTGPRGQLLVT